ncbi:SLAM family member 7-like [Clarias gariepinus]|uniref:SLAM family member 7-like n=1 Tax=Clarias gariepinus TaxID=13013 RepID=UPI00234DC2AF|nr:SLAM family member 7-like [Clarias gariepinus]
MGRCVSRVPRHHLILLFLFLSVIFSSAGESSVQDLIGAVGDSVTFPISVPVSGNLIYNGNTVGLVLNKQSDTELSEKFGNRLQWVSQSGFFTLSDLRTDDSGLYTVQSTKEPKGKQDYQLEVYERVSAPQVMNTTSNTSEFCSFLCSVRNVRGLKLSSYEDGVLLNQTSSSDTSDITLNLHLEIKKTNNYRERTFSCVASNPVSNKTTTIIITDSCSLNTEGNVNDSRTGVIIPVICTVLLSAAVILMVVYLWKKKQNESSRSREDLSASEGLREEVQYSVINHKKKTLRSVTDGLSNILLKLKVKVKSSVMCSSFSLRALGFHILEDISVVKALVNAVV